MRRRLLLALAALLLLGSCTAAGLSLATRDGEGRGTVTARADVAGPARAEATTPAAGSRASSGAEEDAGTTGRVLEREGTAADGVVMTVTGTTSGLVPGRAGQVLPVTVTKPASNPPGTVLTLTDLRVSVTGPAASCPPEDLRLGPVTARPVVARGRSVVVPVAVLFVDRPDRDQTDCVGRTFPLSLSATAEVSR